MANIYEDLAAAAAQAQEEIARNGKVSGDTANKLQQANAAVADFEKKIDLASNAAMSLVRTFTTYNRAVTDGVKGYKDLASTTDQLATSIEMLSAALAFVLPIGRFLKVVVAGAGLLAGELMRNSKIIGEQLDGLKSGFDELAQVGGTTAAGLSNMFEIMQKFGLSAKDFPQFSRELGESSQLLSTFNGSVSTGIKNVADLTQSLDPFKKELMGYGIPLEKMGEASLGFIKSQRLMSIGTNANLNMGRDAMMAYVKEMDLITRLTGISRKEQEKAHERAMSNASYAATIDDLLSQNKTKEAQAIRNTVPYLAALGPNAEKGFQDIISGFVHSQEAQDLMLATNSKILDLGDKLRSGMLNDHKDLYVEIQSMYREATNVQEDIGRNASMLGTTFGTSSVEMRKAALLMGKTPEEVVELAQQEQKKRDKMLDDYFDMLIKNQARMKENQDFLLSMSTAYMKTLELGTGALDKLKDAALSAAEKLNIVGGMTKAVNAVSAAAEGDVKGVAKSGGFELAGNVAGALGSAKLGAMGGAAIGAMTGPLAPVASPVLGALGGAYGAWAGWKGVGALGQIADRAIAGPNEEARPPSSNVSGKTSGVNPILIEKLGMAAAELGKTVQIVSGERSFAKQAELYLNYITGDRKSVV